jgi:hypothetical protein
MNASICLGESGSRYFNSSRKSIGSVSLHASKQDVLRRELLAAAGDPRTRLAVSLSTQINVRPVTLDLADSHFITFHFSKPTPGLGEGMNGCCGRQALNLLGRIRPGSRSFALT